eukprot:12053025-Alexandrium_andersonii.AAC.1
MHMYRRLSLGPGTAATLAASPRAAEWRSTSAADSPLRGRPRVAPRTSPCAWPVAHPASESWR